MGSFSGTVSKSELKATFPPTKAPDPIYAKGGSIGLAISPDCSALTGGFTNSMTGTGGAAIYGGLYMKRASGPWMVVEGACADWSGTWTLGGLPNEGSNPQMLGGWIDYTHTGGPCSPPSGARYHSYVTVMFNPNGTWLAHRYLASPGGKGEDPNSICDYTGKVVGNMLVGTYYCGVRSKVRGPYKITITRP